MQEAPPTRMPISPRKGKEREPPQSTDIAERLVAFQRRNAHATRPREKAERPPQPSSSTPRAVSARPPSPRRMHAPPLPNPNIIVSQPSMEADPDDFSRRLKITANSPRSSHNRANGGVSSNSPGKLYNPNSDTTRKPVITAEPDTISDAASSSYAPRALSPHASRAHPQSQQSRGANDPHRQLFDHRKDDPVRFSVLTRPHPPNMPNGTNQLGNRPTPTPKSSGDYVSASSTSSASYAHSTISSSFTLSSSTTDASSNASSVFDNPNGRRSEDSASSANAFSMQLKKVYRAISTLENRILSEDKDRERDEEGDREAQRVGVLVKGRLGTSSEVKGGDEEAEKERWKRLIADHKELAEKMHYLLSMTLAPNVPTSLRNIPTKYNLIIRLWTTAFHRLLETLRRAAMPPTSSAIALEHLQDFIYYAYTFYTGLLEEHNLSAFRSGWLEALGDLARYRMAVSALVEGTTQTTGTLTLSAIRKAAANTVLSPHVAKLGITNASATSDRQGGPSSNQASPTPAARIDDEDSPPSSHGGLGQNIPSVGIIAARLMELEPEKEQWRLIARQWFARGLAKTPGAGKLHHHLGLLSREKDGNEEELRGMYHFVKSMMTLHPFATSRESILPLWSPPAQARRQTPDARLTELFVLLHGMIFTNIELDNFQNVLERFEEKLQLEGGEVVEEREWIMMAVTNIGALLEYGRSGAVLRRVAGIGGNASPVAGHGTAAKVKLMMAKRPETDEKPMDVDDEDEDAGAARGEKSVNFHASPSVSEAVAASNEPELPMALQHAMRLTFFLLSHTLRKPTRITSPFARSTLNPYLTIMLTFLATVLKDRHTLSVFERSVPWAELAAFLNTIPRRLLLREQQKDRADSGMLLTSGSAPLPEDWCLRGLGWGYRKVYERGFWKKDANAGLVDDDDYEHSIEQEVLDRVESREQMMDGIIEDGDDDEQPDLEVSQNETKRRWVRVARAGLKIAKYVDGFHYQSATSSEDRGHFSVEGALASKIARWEEEDRLAREAEERRLRGTRWDEESMDVDDDDSAIIADESTDDSDDDEYVSAEVKALKAQRRYLRSLLQSSRQGGARAAVVRREPRASKTQRTATQHSVRMVPGYTILVVDTNILLSSLSSFASLVERLKWTIVVPLPVIMELDGLSSNSSVLGQAASAALDYITSHIRSHSLSLKVLTSKGNYLSTLSVRTEQVDFAAGEASWERNMDDLILRTAIWQDGHWVDRSTLLKAVVDDVTGAAKVVLLTLDRMLRLKARSRGLCAANEKDLASVLPLET